MSPGKQRFFAAALAVLAIGTAGSTVYYNHEQRESTQCQAEFNQRFLQQLKERTEIANSDRESLEELVRAVVNSDSRSASRAALKEYLETKDENDEQRREHPLPELTAESAHC